MNYDIYLIFYRDIARMKITVTVGRMKIVPCAITLINLKFKQCDSDMDTGSVKKLFLLIIFF